MACFSYVDAMQQTMKYVFGAAVLILAILAVAGTYAVMPASAQAGSGEFDPQTQFAVGSNLQITSIYGLETTPPPFITLNGPGLNYGSHTWGNYGQNGNRTQTSRTGLLNQQWNLTNLRNSPTANSSITINVQVTNNTEQGGILWVVQGGSIDYNGTTLTVTSGSGGISKLDRVITIGNATDSNGNTFMWSLEGLTVLYGGSVIVCLTGSVAQLNQNMTPVAPTRPFQGETLRAVSLTYIATIS